VKRYIQDFSKIILLHLKDFSIDQIRIATGFSNRLIDEYILLYQTYLKQDSTRLSDLFGPVKKKARS